MRFVSKGASDCDGELTDFDVIIHRQSDRERPSELEQGRHVTWLLPPLDEELDDYFGSTDRQTLLDAIEVED